MPRTRDVLCAGGCGQLIWRGRGSQSPGKATCQACRRRPQRRICSACGQEFQAALSPGRYRRRTCTDGCRDEAVRAGAAIGGTLGAGKLRGQRPACVVCDAEFRRTYQAQRTCGRVCGGRLNAWERTRYMIIAKQEVVTLTLCEGCGKPGPNLVCGTPCRLAAVRAARRQRPRSCIDCGSGDVEYKKAVCAECRHKRQRASLKRSRKRQKARDRGLEHEPYTLDEIAARDGYRCGICRKRVAMTKAVPHPRSPTIDHLIPRSEFGPDTPANVQLAHFICNSRRGAGGTVQLALVG